MDIFILNLNASDDGFLMAIPWGGYPVHFLPFREFATLPKHIPVMGVKLFTCFSVSKISLTSSMFGF
jgi:hypothetical protein